MNKKKLIFVGLDAPSFTRFRLSLAKLLSKNGYDVSLCVDGFVEDVEVNQTGIGCSHSIQKNHYNFYCLAYLFRVLLFSRDKPIIVSSFFVPNVIAGFLRCIFRFKHFAFIDGMGFQFTRNTGKQIRLRKVIRNITVLLYSRLFKYSDGIFVMNVYDQGLMKKILKNNVCVHNLEGIGVNDKNYSFISDESFEKTPLKVAFAGRLHTDKGLQVLLRAWTSFKSQIDCEDVELHLAGALSSNLSGSINVDDFKSQGIKFCGFVDMSSWLQDKHLLVLPTYREGFPVVVIEALITGVPCVVSNVPGCATLTRKYKLATGFRAGDSDGLCEILVEGYKHRFQNLRLPAHLYSEIRKSSLLKRVHKDKIILEKMIEKVG